MQKGSEIEFSSLAERNLILFDSCGDSLLNVLCHSLKVSCRSNHQDNHAGNMAIEDVIYVERNVGSRGIFLSR